MCKKLRKRLAVFIVFSFFLPVSPLVSVAPASAADLELRLVILKSPPSKGAPSFRPGDPVECLVMLENRTAKPVRVNRRLAIGPEDYPFKEIFFMITDAGGRAVPFNDVLLYGSPPFEEDFKELAPGERAVAVYTLDNWYVLEQEGEFTVQAHYENTFAPQAGAAWQGRLLSNREKFRIR